ncbi:MAG: VCBS repeat-containing protein [Pirellulaceae bacterium]|nr:VCBS repeat-containing protein [Pirellulaceae bacterium]
MATFLLAHLGTAHSARTAKAAAPNAAVISLPVILLCSGMFFIGCQLGCQRNDRPVVDVESPKLAERMSAINQSIAQSPQIVSADPDPIIEKFCSHCHRLPKPASFAREAWYDEIHKGFEFYARSGRNDLQPPALKDVLAYYRAHAPESIEFPAPPAVDQNWRDRFNREPLNWQDSGDLSPAVSSIKLMRWDSKASNQVVVTDMRSGSINLVTLTPSQSSAQLLTRVGVPARTTPCDLDEDGVTDLLVADLGSFNPYDHAFGQVLWLYRDPATTNLTVTPLIEHIGRVADVCVGDFAGDGRLDVALAEFGHRETGAVRLLVREGDQSMNFTSRKLDHRPGAVQLSAFDWDDDGRTDIATIFSQEFESVELLLNRTSKFDKVKLHQGDDLTSGSVGLEPVDLDRDGDMDLLVVHGDCFDNNFANLSHGVGWLEYRGELRFQYHRLLDLPGAYRAVPADMDHDGDMDLVAVANLPTNVYPQSLTDQNPASVVLLEQTTPKRTESTSLTFESHVLERGTPRYPALEVADFNQDGQMDFAVGTLLFDTDPPHTAAAQLPRMAVWWQKP